MIYVILEHPASLKNSGLWEIIQWPKWSAPLPKSPRLYNGTLFLLPLRGRVYFPTLNLSWSCGLLWSVEGGGPGLSLASRGLVPFCSLLGTLPSCHVNEPGLALWRTTPWGAERSHPSWGYPSPAMPQPTWQRTEDGWVSPGETPRSTVMNHTRVANPQNHKLRKGWLFWAA